jgi:hypothetical protein
VTRFAAALLLLLAGCERHYLVPRTAAERLAQTPPDEREHVAVAAESDHGRVYVRGSALVMDRPSDAQTVRARTGGMHSLTTAGIAIAVAGSVLAGIGGVVWSYGARHDGGAVAPIGEGIVGVGAAPALVGGILAIIGATRGATREVAAGRKDLIYLDAAAGRVSF